MRAIANEQFEDFPERDVVESVFVEHEIEEGGGGLSYRTTWTSRAGGG